MQRQFRHYPLPSTDSQRRQKKHNLSYFCFFHFPKNSHSLMIFLTSNCSARCLDFTENPPANSASDSILTIACFNFSSAFVKKDCSQLATRSSAGVKIPYSANSISTASLVTLVLGAKISRGPDLQSTDTTGSPQVIASKRTYDNHSYNEERTNTLDLAKKAKGLLCHPNKYTSL